MNNPCPKRVLCPPGTGIESPGFNYSSEVVDAPEFFGVYFPPTVYGYYTSCQGRCTSLISQLDADLCAQRQAVICQSSQGHGPDDKPKPTFGNTPQICTEPGTGRLVTVPANVFYAESQGEADAMALAFANRMQKDPGTPPGVTPIPPPTQNPQPPVVVTPIPRPTPQPPKKPTPPVGSHCKPCDDTVGVDTFVIAGGVPMGTQLQVWDTAPLKCGSWKIEVTGGPFAVAAQSFITLDVLASDGSTLSWGSFFDCPQPAWVCPCGSDPDCAVQTTQQFGFYPGCCAQSDVTCSYATCADGNHLMIFRFSYVYGGTADPTTPAKNFTVHGTWLGPIPGA